MNHIFAKRMLLMLVAILVGTCGWICLQRVLIPHQVADSAITGRPRGNLSDLYPRWLGARELLLHRRDPYSAEVTREIQAGYYGRPLDPTRPADPKDEQRFAYPLYVVFYLAPTVHASFASVQVGFFWILVVLTVASVPIWLRVVQWSPGWWAQISIMAIALGSLGVMQGLKLHQLTLFVVPMIATAMLLFVTDQQVAAGVLLALSTVKPQLVWLLVVWLLIWSSSDWRRRWRWLVAFLAVVTVLGAASEWVLPGWLPQFLNGLIEYRRYTGNVSVVEEMLPRQIGRLVELIALLATLYIGWKTRRYEASSRQTASTISLVLAVTLFVLPAFAPYNYLLLLPGILLLLRDWRTIWSRGYPMRTLLIVTAALFAWPYLSATTMAAFSSVIPSEELQKYWAVPFWTSLAMPVGVTALLLFYTHRTSVDGRGEPQAA